MTPDQFALCPDPIWVCDPAETRIISCNDAACRFMGRDRSSLTGLAPTDLGLGGPDGMIHIERPGGPTVFADLSRTDINRDGAPARLLTLVLHPKSMAGAIEDSPARFPHEMKRLMLLSGYAFIGTDAPTGQIQMTPQLQVIFGLGEGATAGSVADLMANVHADDLPRYLADSRLPQIPAAYPKRSCGCCDRTGTSATSRCRSEPTLTAASANSGWSRI
jgi:hypothetical protein